MPVADLRDYLTRLLTPTSLEEVYREKYGEDAYYPSLLENVGASAGAGLKALGVPKHIAETQGRNIASLASDWSPFGTLTGLDEAQRAAAEGDVAGSALGAGGTALAIFGGPGAKLADKAKLALAKQMAEGGAARKAIWDATGWFQGADKNWRFEIPDQPAKLTPGGERDWIEGAYEGPAGPLYSQPDMFGQPPGERSGFLDHPELFANYPQLADLPIRAESSLTNEAGGYSKKGIDVAASTRPKTREIALHELQHAVQDIEGFARGGNPADRSLQKDAQKVKAFAQRGGEKLRDELRDWVTAQGGGGGDLLRNRELALRWTEEFPEKARDLYNYENIGTAPAGPTRGYYHLAGEVEPRNVERRSRMGPDELSAQAPWETQDLPDPLQIIRSQAGKEGSLPQASVSRDDLAGMFREGVQPQVPQSPIPRYEPPRGVPARTAELVANPEVRDKVMETVQRGVGMGGAEWYNAEPLRLAFVDELGPEAGTQAFNRYMDMVAATSPRSKVPENVRNASFYYALGNQPLPSKNPEPYGHLAQNLHRMNVERIRGGGFDPMVNPKPVSFAANLQGNQMPVTVDTHAFRLPAVLSQDPRFLATNLQTEPGVSRNIKKEFEADPTGIMAEAAERPAFWETQPGKNEYAAMERYYQDIGRDLGLTGAQTQSAAWVGGGEETGLASEASKTFMDFFKDRLLKTAVDTKMDPRDVLSRFIRGEGALRALGGVTLGAGALGALPEEERDRL